jgi:hypothetical protein
MLTIRVVAVVGDVKNWDKMPPLLPVVYLPVSIATCWVDEGFAG